MKVVTVEGRGLQGAVTSVTFLLRQTDSAWSIVYDTMTQNALRTYVATYRAFDPDPRRRLSNDAAAQAANVVSRIYERQARVLAPGYF